MYTKAWKKTQRILSSWHVHYSISLKNNVTQRKLHLCIKIQSLMPAEPARQNRYPKCTHKPTFYGLPRTTLSSKFNSSWKLRSVRTFFCFASSRWTSWHFKIIMLIDFIWEFEKLQDFPNDLLIRFHNFYRNPVHQCELWALILSKGL